MSKNKINTDICIIGGGLVGLTAALKLAQTNNQIVVVSPNATQNDSRTTAVLMSSTKVFEDIGLWEKLIPKSFPLKTMRIVDGTSNLLRAPQTDFNANEIELDAFGYNLKNQDTLDLLEAEIKNNDNIIMIDGSVEDITHYDGKELIQAKLSDQSSLEITSNFLVGADGRNSIVRKSKKITVREWEYPQSAMVLDFTHERSTQYTSTEFHTNSGPFTIVPQAHNSAGLVWMEKPDVVSELITKSNEELASIMEEKMQSFLGKITLQTKPQSFPLKGLVANSFGEQNYALIGEAAHVFPPIGAQGFNLGVRDIIGLCEVVARYTNQENRGLQYDKLRKLDINARTYGVDLLNRSLITQFLPAQILRGVGLHALGSISPLRKYAMKMGISPSS